MKASMDTLKYKAKSSKKSYSSKVPISKRENEHIFGNYLSSNNRRELNSLRFSHSKAKDTVANNHLHTLSESPFQDEIPSPKTMHGFENYNERGKLIRHKYLDLSKTAAENLVGLSNDNVNDLLLKKDVSWNKVVKARQQSGTNIISKAEKVKNIFIPKVLFIFKHTYFQLPVYYKILFEGY